MKKVLIVTSALITGGVELCAVNIAENLDKEKFECEFCVESGGVAAIEKRLENSGINIINRKKSTRNIIEDYREIRKIIESGNYDAVHSHVTFYSGLVMLAAKKSGVKKRVAHAHATKPAQRKKAYRRMMFRIYRVIMRRLIKHNATDLLACGPEAGNFVFGKKEFKKRGILLNNGIDLDKYNFDETIRKSAKQELGIDESTTVFGHVGTINYVKNHSFLVDVFAEYLKKNSNAMLLIVGDGQKKAELLQKIDLLNISDKVIITGVRNDVERMLMAMDIMVFPSFHEGLPLALVEAQASKLPCIISDTVTRSAKLNDNVLYLSLEKGAKEWMECAEKMLTQSRNSIDTARVRAEYDIKNVVRKLEKIYLR